MRKGGKGFEPVKGWDRTWRAKSIRALNGQVIAIGIQRDGRDYPTMVLNSDYTTYNNPADIWIADTDNSASSNVLADLPSALVDGWPMQDRMFLYGTKSTWTMEPTYDNAVFRYRRVFESDSGVISQNCVIDVSSNHFVFGPESIWTHNGLARQDIVDGTVRRDIYDHLVMDEKAKFFVVYIAERNEIMFCHVSTHPDCKFKLPEGDVPAPGCNRAAVFNLKEGKWSFDDLPFVLGAAVVSASTGKRWEEFASTETWALEPHSWQYYTDRSRPSPLFIARSQVPPAPEPDPELETPDPVQANDDEISIEVLSAPVDVEFADFAASTFLDNDTGTGIRIASITQPSNLIARLDTTTGLVSLSKPIRRPASGGEERGPIAGGGRLTNGRTDLDSTHRVFVGSDASPTFDYRIKLGDVFLGVDIVDVRKGPTTELAPGFEVLYDETIEEGDYLQEDIPQEPDYSLDDRYVVFNPERRKVFYPDFTANTMRSFSLETGEEFPLVPMFGPAVDMGYGHQANYVSGVSCGECDVFVYTRADFLDLCYIDLRTGFCNYIPNLGSYRLCSLRTHSADSAEVIFVGYVFENHNLMKVGFTRSETGDVIVTTTKVANPLGAGNGSLIDGDGRGNIAYTLNGKIGFGNGDSIAEVAITPGADVRSICVNGEELIVYVQSVGFYKYNLAGQQIGFKAYTEGFDSIKKLFGPGRNSVPLKNLMGYNDGTSSYTSIVDLKNLEVSVTFNYPASIIQASVAWDGARGQFFYSGGQGLFGFIGPGYAIRTRAYKRVVDSAWMAEIMASPAPAPDVRTFEVFPATQVADSRPVVRAQSFFRGTAGIPTIEVRDLYAASPTNGVPVPFFANTAGPAHYLIAAVGAGPIATGTGVEDGVTTSPYNAGNGVFYSDLGTFEAGEAKPEYTIANATGAFAIGLTIDYPAVQPYDPGFEPVDDRFSYTITNRYGTTSTANVVVRIID
ncbi:hypothetical protein ASG59_18670 [Methylobacterium sp. Leaf466]|nr:hypothetical protein ASG59_18670 [Methylobacterium sp. Leaf466]